MQLRELNLSENQIENIEGMETLANLEKLNLNANKIKEIPKSIQFLKNLKIFKIAKNQI